MSINVSKPRISIVTVVCNDVANIERTILSILNQTYNDIEYIIIDGGSTDGTVDVIKKYQEGIYYWISEKDKGIYDAMNKGIAVATGEWINFINSGDSYHSNTVLHDVAKSPAFGRLDVDVIYGNTQIVSLENQKRKLSIAGDYPDKQWMGPVFLHGTMFVRTKLQKLFLFKLSDKYKICADFDFIYHLFHDGYRFVKLNLIILNFMEGGVSSNRIQCALDNKMVVLSYTNKIGYRMVLNFLVARAYIIEVIIVPILKKLKFNF